MSNDKRRALKRRIESWDDLYALAQDRPATQACQPWAEMFEAPHAKTPREMVITAVARLEVALTELLQLRLVEDTDAQEAFLGIYADADRAPAGDLGAKIGLAYLVGLLPKGMPETLHRLRRLRNLMAHRVNISLLDPRAQREIRAFRDEVLVDPPRRTTGSAKNPDDELDCTELATEHPYYRLMSALERVRDDAAVSATDETAAATVVWSQALAMEFALRLIRGHDIPRIKEWDEEDHEHGSNPANPAPTSGGTREASGPEPTEP